MGRIENSRVPVRKMREDFFFFSVSEIVAIGINEESILQLNRKYGNVFFFIEKQMVTVLLCI